MSQFRHFPKSKLLNLEAYMSSFLYNHKSSLSGLIYCCFSLCFQESRSGETNSCVEEIIRVRTFLYKSYQLLGQRFPVERVMWLHCQREPVVCCLAITFSEGNHVSCLNDTLRNSTSFGNLRATPQLGAFVRPEVTLHESDQLGDRRAELR